jgi:NADPH:quinone reductase-like Zn-dependent oxidoreductase
MKAIRLHARSGPESLRFEDAPRPRPGAGEVLVRVHAAGVTPTELLWAPTWATRDGGPRPLPVIPGHEFSGEVAALGEGVTAVGVGEPVYGMNDWFGDWVQAEYCLALPGDPTRCWRTDTSRPAGRSCCGWATPGERRTSPYVGTPA